MARQDSEASSKRYTVQRASQQARLALRQYRPSQQARQAYRHWSRLLARPAARPAARQITTVRLRVLAISLQLEILLFTQTGLSLSMHTGHPVHRRSARMMQISTVKQAYCDITQ